MPPSSVSSLWFWVLRGDSVVQRQSSYCEVDRTLCLFLWCRASHMLGKCSRPSLHPWPKIWHLEMVPGTGGRGEAAEKRDWPGMLSPGSADQSCRRLAVSPCLVRSHCSHSWFSFWRRKWGSVNTGVWFSSSHLNLNLSGSALSWWRRCGWRGKDEPAAGNWKVGDSQIREGGCRKHEHLPVPSQLERPSRFSSSSKTLL